MLDKWGRSIHYLRLSVTDLCNLRCCYCMPEQGISKLPHDRILSVEEIVEIASASASCGVDKVRITGGEPLVRKGILDICGRVAEIRGIKELCLTTNGVLLKEFAGPLKNTGVRRINLSLDTLKSERFTKITRIGNLTDALDGLQAAREVGFENIKINVVLIGGFNDDEIPDFIEMTKEWDIQVRFIELMPMGECANWDKSSFISADAVLSAAQNLKQVGLNGVAQVYQMPGYRGTVGLIRPMSNHFCPECNRIRVTADGRLKTCLHSDQEVDLKNMSKDQIRLAISRAVWDKPQRHFLSDTRPSETSRNMNEIGG